MKLSENFNLEEFTHSDTAEKKSISNIPNVNVIENLKGLCGNVLEPLRNHFAKNDRNVKLYINSGYRCPALNKAVGGANNSNHLYGYAADIAIDGVRAKVVYMVALGMLKAGELKLTELFYEKHGISEWVHIAYNPNELTKPRTGEIIKWKS